MFPGKRDCIRRQEEAGRVPSFYQALFGRGSKEVQFSLVAQWCPTLRPHELQHPRPPCPSPTPRVHSDSTSIESVMRSKHLILCRHVPLLPPIPPSIRVFSNESTLHMRWPKYWSFPCPTLCDPIDGSPPGSPVPGILQARSLEWVAIPFCRRST